MTGGRSAVAWAGVVVAAGAVAAVWALGGWPDAGDPPDEAPPAVDLPSRPLGSEATALSGPRAREVERDGVDPSTGRTARAEIRFVAEDGSPVPRVKASYAPVRSEDAPLRGTADAAGRMPVHASVVGQRLLVDVAEGPTWGAERFDLWAVDTTEVVLARGCQVWLILNPEDVDLVGRACSFRVDDVPRAVPLTGTRSLLGSFRGSVLVFDEVDGWPAADRDPHALPASGALDVPWEGAGGRRASLRFQAPAGVTETPRVRLTAIGARTAALLEPSASGPDWVEYRTSPSGKSYLYVAACGDAWAFGRISKGERPLAQRFPPRWERGCRLEAVLPEPDTLLSARAFVVSDPLRPLPAESGPDVESHFRILQVPEADWIDFGAELAAPEGFAWPVEPDLTRSRVVWRSVPNGCVLRLLVGGTRQGTLSHDVTIPAKTERLQVTLHPTVSFTLEISGARTTLPGEEEWLSVACDEGRRGTCTVFLPREQSRVAVRGFPAGTTADVSVYGGGVRGEAHMPVKAGMTVPLVLRAERLHRFRARVVDPAGRPLAGVGVEFAGGRGGTGPMILRTDAEGFASREVVVAEASGAPGGEDAESPENEVTAEVADPRYVSARVTCPRETAALLETSTNRALRLVFDLGRATVNLSITAAQRDGLRLRVAPGSVLTRFVGEAARATVRVEDDVTGALLFERAVDLADVATTLHVAR